MELIIFCNDNPIRKHVKKQFSKKEKPTASKFKLEKKTNNKINNSKQELKIKFLT